MEKRLIQQILLEQREEIGKIFKGKIIPREVEAKARLRAHLDLIEVIMGVRRSGKSVLAHQLLKGKPYGYVNFDDERLIGIHARDLNDFLEVLLGIHPGVDHLLLDEVQNVEGWELFANRLRRKGYHVMVTGSNAKLLSKELATHLTGRHFSVELFPFSFREFLSYKGLHVQEKDFYVTEKKVKIRKHLEEYLREGGFPETLHIESKADYLRELYHEIITRDIILRYNVRYAKDLKEIALYVLSLFGSRISLHKIRKIFEMKSVHTVKNYLHYLEESYLFFPLHSFSFKLKEQLKQPKKIYGIDTGLIHALAPQSQSDYGKFMENLVFLELKRQNKEIYFYFQRDCEIDFLVRAGREIKQLIQVCYSLTDAETKKREMKAFVKASQKLRCKNWLLITWDEEGEETFSSHKIKIVPLWKWLLVSNKTRTVLLQNRF